MLWCLLCCRTKCCMRWLWRGPSRWVWKPVNCSHAKTKSTCVVASSLLCMWLAVFEVYAWGTECCSSARTLGSLPPPPTLAKPPCVFWTRYPKKPCCTQPFVFHLNTTEILWPLQVALVISSLVVLRNPSGDDPRGRVWNLQELGVHCVELVECSCTCGWRCFLLSCRVQIQLNTCGSYFMVFLWASGFWCEISHRDTPVWKYDHT